MHINLQSTTAINLQKRPPRIRPASINGYLDSKTRLEHEFDCWLKQIVNREQLWILYLYLYVSAELCHATLTNAAWLQSRHLSKTNLPVLLLIPLGTPLVSAVHSKL